MLTLPFLATDAGAADTAKAPKPTDAKPTDRREDGAAFSDVYDETAPEEATQEIDPAVRNAEQSASDGKDPEDNDTGVDADETSLEETAQVDGRVDLSNVLKETPAEARTVRSLSAAEEASAFAKAIKALERTATHPVSAKPEQVVLSDAKAVPAQADGAKVAQATTATSQAAAIAVEAADDLAPMRVQVRDTTSSGGTAVQANLQASQPVQVLPRGQAIPEAQAAARTETGKADAPVMKGDVPEEAPRPSSRDMATATSSTTQWRAQAVPEQVQTVSAPLQKTEADVAQVVDPALSARDESTVRSANTGFDLPQQARAPQAAANPAYVVKQVADAVRTSDKGVIEITMDPPELGRLRLSMSETAGTMNIAITTEQTATSELMRKHIELLRRDFMEMGYDNVSFSFEQGDMSGQQQSEQPHQTGETGSAGPADQADPANADPVPTPSPQQPTGVSAGLDIRL